MDISNTVLGISEIDSLVPKYYDDWYVNIFPGDKTPSLFIMGEGILFPSEETAKFAEAAKYIPHLSSVIKEAEELMIEVAQHLQRPNMGQDNNEFAARMIQWTEKL